VISLKKVLIFGTGKTSYNVVNSLEDDIIIVAFIDNDKSKLGFKDSYPVISAGEIRKFEYDYIIIASQYEEEIFQQLKELNIDERKIVRYYKWYDFHNNYVEKAISEYHSNSDYRGIVTGISYTRAAILENCMKYRFAIVAFPSQDIKHDYKMARYIIHDKDNNKIDYCIIGLSYYSFQYDLLKSAMKNKACFYEFMDIKQDGINYKFEVENIIFKKESSLYFAQEQEFNKLEDNIKWEIGQKQAFIDCNKNYPKTVKENKKIFKEYLKLLNRNKIRTIVVVCPASKYYTKYFSEKIEDEFHEIIKEVRQEYNFQYIDYFRSKEFDDSDFEDVSHLNIKGAERFTRTLNEIIKW
jgi:hypothetical protein